MGKYVQIEETFQHVWHINSGCLNCLNSSNASLYKFLPLVLQKVCPFFYSPLQDLAPVVMVLKEAAVKDLKKGVFIHSWTSSGLKLKA